MPTRRHLAEAGFRIGGCALIALLAGSDFAINALRGHGLLLLVTATLIGVPCMLAVHSRRMPLPVAGEAAGVAFALMFMGIQYNSPFGLLGDFPYVLHAALATVTLAVGMAFGKWSSLAWAPETDVERARP